MEPKADYPTPEHRRAAGAILDFFFSRPEVQAVLLFGSCARGKATRDSCLDVAVLVPPEALSAQGDTLEERWDAFRQKEAAFQELKRAGRYSQVDLDFIDGVFFPRPRGWTSGPDGFELDIGNYLVYSVSLWEKGPRLAEVKSHWLPYYGEALRRERLALVRRHCLNNLDHIPLFVERGLYFQAFHRLCDAFREFLQALFISRRTYPIAYDKWIREQMERILGMPELYGELPRLFEIRAFERPEIAQKAARLRELLERYAPEEKGGGEDGPAH